MAADPVNSFAEILASLDCGPDNFAPGPDSASKQPAPPDVDYALRLSIQAEKALSAPARKTGLASNASTADCAMKRKADQQGNRVTISPLADSLALAQSDSVAWETCIPKSSRQE